MTFFGRCQRITISMTTKRLLRTPSTISANDYIYRPVEVTTTCQQAMDVVLISSLKAANRLFATVIFNFLTHILTTVLEVLWSSANVLSRLLNCSSCWRRDDDISAL